MSSILSRVRLNRLVSSGREEEASVVDVVYQARAKVERRSRPMYGQMLTCSCDMAAMKFPLEYSGCS